MFLRQALLGVVAACVCSFPVTLLQAQSLGHVAAAEASRRATVSKDQPTTAPVLAQDDGSPFGTDSVSFAPIQVGGSLRGCTLVYEAVVADHAYLSGNPVQAVGSLTVHVQDPNVTLALKLGVRSILGRGQRFEAPHFAYLQSANSSTAKLRYVSGDGAEGFRLFIVRLLDDQALEVLMEALQARKVVVGFNREEGGLDVLVPVDLTVVRTDISGDKAVRTRSSEPVQAFGQCVLKVVDGALKQAR